MSLDKTKRTNNYAIYKTLPEELKEKVGTPLQYVKLMSAFNQFLMNYIIYTGKSFLLPFHMGELTIFRRATKTDRRKFIDYNHYKLTGEKRNHTNKHTEGYYASMIWYCTPTRTRELPYRTMFRFKINDDIKHDMIRAIKNDNTIYKYPEF